MKENVVTTYLRECVEILRQITWPTKNQAIRYTVITFVFCGAFALFLAASDFVFHAIYDYLVLQ
ncbi:preprotein translocase subunit SecE [Candidatus Peregrinibacteria bacterium]|jgi:preprotein translocase SecE subunit|nr:preprotein translocase subunit SecE [Candidatus Peregrinibacteria bacterium]